MNFHCERGCTSASNCELADSLRTQAQNLKRGSLAVKPVTVERYVSRSEEMIRQVCAAPGVARASLQLYRQTAKSLFQKAPSQK